MFFNNAHIISLHLCVFNSNEYEFGLDKPMITGNAYIAGYKKNPSPLARG